MILATFFAALRSGVESSVEKSKVFGCIPIVVTKQLKL